MQMVVLKVVVLTFLGCTVLSCASAVDVGKGPLSTWMRFAKTESQDLIVEFESVASKRVAIEKLRTKDVEVLKDYETLPLLYLRFHVPSALKELLGSPEVVNVYENQPESLLPAK
jgi:hypothetical protein